MKTFVLSVALATHAVACSTSEVEKTGSVEKADAFSAKADTDLQRRVCRDLGYPADCDVCDVAGWYGDGECDTFCDKLDPDCGTQCQDDADCPPIYCITTPCPRNVCESGKCEQQHFNQCFGAFIGENGQCRSAVLGTAPADCCACEGAERRGRRSLCLNQYDVTVDDACCDSVADAGVGATCRAQDARGVGECPAVFGQRWNGSRCEWVGGCSCEGSDCEALYLTESDCEAANASCAYDGGTAKNCHITGCSSQVCSDDPNVFTPCDWQPEYACYRDATCEPQADGVCGWTDTPELQRCLADI